ncbi:hypothetical protein D0962_34475 [Leptolyngbyaceae cyanobacterium CCMR0082]|uniref:Transposase IS30-like HTH domain-containing protein n=1 Tax=Adonisia turfae CCMR0082 TaxID=2304604 RepID=A0A6M0SH35_9CYAN|nr:hypothetical protein [Adonisia turfae CCMR0082]
MPSRLGSVQDLRNNYHWISCKYPKLGLAELQDVLNKLQSGELLPPEPVSIDDFREASPLTKSKLSREEIKRLHESGKSLRQIAKMAGISHQGVAYHLD